MTTMTTKTATATRRRARPSALALGVRRTGLELRQFFRDGMGVAFIFAFPVVMLMIFGSVFKDNDIGEGVTFLEYFLPGILATGILLSSFQNLALAIADERDVGLLKRLRGTPMPPSAYLIGKIGQVLVTGLVQTALTLGVAALMFGVDLPSEPSKWLTFAWVYLLGTAAGCVLGVGVSTLPKSGSEANAIVTPVVIVLQFISGVYFVFANLPEWMQSVASVFPLKWMAQGMRSVFLPEGAAVAEASGSWQLGWVALVLGVWVAVGVALCLKTFRWTRRDAG